MYVSALSMHLCIYVCVPLGFSGGSDCKESACSAGDLGWEDPMEKGMATHSVFLPGEFHGQRSLASYSPWDCKESDMTEQLTGTYTHISSYHLARYHLSI